MVGRLAAAGPARRGPRRRDRRRRRRRVGLGHRGRARRDAPRPVAATVVPLCGGYWSTGPEREPYRRVADALGGQPRGLMAPGLVDDAATQARRSSPTPASGRSLDLWERLDVALFGIGGPAWSVAAVGDARRPAARGRRGGRRGAHRAVRPRRPASSARRLRERDDRVRCPPARSRAGRRSASPAGEAKVRPILGALRAGVVRRSSPTSRPPRPSSRCDAATLAPRRDGDDDGPARPAILGIDLGTTEVKAGLVDARRPAARPRPGRLPDRTSAAARLGRAGSRAPGGPPS